MATVGATLWFDVFLTEPYGRLAITHRPDIETAACLLVVGIIVTELASRNRHHYAIATEEADYVGLIYEVSELVASGAPATDVRERVRTRWSICSTSEPAATKWASALRPMMRLEHDGHVLLGGRVWGVERMGLPGPEIELLVQNRGDILGRFILTSDARLRGATPATSGCCRTCRPSWRSAAPSAPQRIVHHDARRIPWRASDPLKSSRATPQRSRRRPR